MNNIYLHLAVPLKTNILSILFSVMVNPGNAQTIPADSLYLGQSPPGDSAVVFAPGIVTIPGRNVPCLSFAPDGKTAAFYVPYLKNKPKNQTGKVGEPFTCVLPDSTIIDDDGNNTLTWYVTSRLPAGFYFDPDTRNISGTPTEAGTFMVTVLVVEAAEASASTSFSLKINKSMVWSSIKKSFWNSLSDRVIYQWPIFNS